jgi:hypothetical protein
LTKKRYQLNEILWECKQVATLLLLS